MCSMLCFSCEAVVSFFKKHILLVLKKTGVRIYLASHEAISYRVYHSRYIIAQTLATSMKTGKTRADQVCIKHKLHTKHTRLGSVSVMLCGKRQHGPHVSGANVSPLLSPFLNQSWRFPSPPRSLSLSPNQRPRCHVSEASLPASRCSFPRLPSPNRHLLPPPCLLE